MESERLSVWKELELGFGTGSKFRVATQLILNSKQAFTKYALAKATGLRTPSVDSQLKTLLKLGWIKEHPFTPTTYQANPENRVVKHIQDFFLELKCVKTGN